MFLANSLNTKLQKSLSEFDVTAGREAKFRYVPKKANPKLLTLTKHDFSPCPCIVLYHKKFESGRKIASFKNTTFELCGNIRNSNKNSALYLKNFKFSNFLKTPSKNEINF